MEDLDLAGFTIADISLSDEQCDQITASLPAVLPSRGGVRNLIEHPTVMKLLLHESLGSYVWSIAGREVVAVNATLFDKTPEANWRVQWHQDRTIGVRQRIDLQGYGPWSKKGGFQFVEPPADVLRQMLAIRVHLDPCGADNGPLRVVPGSHRSGKLSEKELVRASRGDSVELAVARGAIVAMRPLLLHASSPSRSVAHRRVLHIEFAPIAAITPLAWQSAVPLRRSMMSRAG